MKYEFFIAGKTRNKENILKICDLFDKYNISSYCFEETGIKVNDVFQLSTVSSIPVIDITGDFSWGKDIYVVPEYSFGASLENCDIHLSNEHKEYQWCLFDEAYEKLKFDSNKTALWELNQRLLNNDMKKD